MAGRKLVEVDTRKRVPLAKVGATANARYLAYLAPDGTVVLEPVVADKAAR